MFKVGDKVVAVENFGDLKKGSFYTIKSIDSPIVKSINAYITSVEEIKTEYYWSDKFELASEYHAFVITNPKVNGILYSTKSIGEAISFIYEKNIIGSSYIHKYNKNEEYDLIGELELTIEGKNKIMQVFTR